LILLICTASGCRLQFDRRGDTIPFRSSDLASTADPVYTDTPLPGLPAAGSSVPAGDHADETDPSARHPAAAAKNRPIVAVFGTMCNGNTNGHDFSSALWARI